MTVSYQGMTFEPYITREQIDAFVCKIAEQISADYAGKTPLVVCILNGAVFFMTDLVRQLTIDCELSFMQLRSYVGTQTTGQVEEVVPLRSDIRGRDVIVVEDIVDTGVTLHYLKARLLAREPRSLKIASLLFKPTELQYEDARPDYYGCEISKEFVIGYGLDLDGLARNLPEIYRLKK